MGVSVAAVRLVGLAVADVVNDMHGNEFWGTVGKLAAKTGLSRETTGLAMKHLAAANVIQLVGDRNGGANHYRWIWSVGNGGVDGTTRQPVDGTTRQGLTGPPDNIKPIEPKVDPKENTRFAEFWEMYPRRRRLGRPSALRAWKKIAPEEHDAVLVGLAAWIAKWDRDRTEPAFIKTPAPWLNDRRWENLEATERPPVRERPGLHWDEGRRIWLQDGAG